MAARLGPALPEDAFIARMKRERLRRGWTQERLASEAQLASQDRWPMHPTAITKLEREPDHKSLRLNEAFYVAEALGLSLERMFVDDDLSGARARIRDLQQQHRALLEELVETERRHNEILGRMAEIGSETGILQEQVASAIEVYEDSSGGHWWRERDAAGLINAQGGPYATKEDALDSITGAADFGEPYEPTEDTRPRARKATAKAARGGKSVGKLAAKQHRAHKATRKAEDRG